MKRFCGEACSSDVIFFSGCRFIPGTNPLTSQLDLAWLDHRNNGGAVTKGGLRSFEERLGHIPWRLITARGESLLLAGCPIVSQCRRS